MRQLFLFIIVQLLKDATVLIVITCSILSKFVWDHSKTVEITKDAVKNNSVCEIFRIVLNIQWIRYPHYFIDATPTQVFWCASKVNQICSENMQITNCVFASSFISIISLYYFLYSLYLFSNEKFKGRASTKVSLRVDSTVLLIQMNIWKIIYLNCGERYEGMIDHCSSHTT